MLGSPYFGKLPNGNFAGGYLTHDKDVLYCTVLCGEFCIVLCGEFCLLDFAGEFLEGSCVSGKVQHQTS